MSLSRGEPNECALTPELVRSSSGARFVDRSVGGLEFFGYIEEVDEDGYANLHYDNGTWRNQASFAGIFIIPE